jgi:hypothetical protein
LQFPLNLIIQFYFILKHSFRQFLIHSHAFHLIHFILILLISLIELVSPSRFLLLILVFDILLFLFVVVLGGQKLDVDVLDFIGEDESGLLSFDPWGFGPVFDLAESEVGEDEVGVGFDAVDFLEVFVGESEEAESGFLF